MRTAYRESNLLSISREMPMMFRPLKPVLMSVAKREHGYWWRPWSLIGEVNTRKHG